MQRAREGPQAEEGMDRRGAGKASWVGIEVLLIGVRETLAKVWLGDVLGLGPGKARRLMQEDAPAWCAVGSYERPTRNRRQLQDRERLEMEQKHHG